MLLLTSWNHFHDGAIIIFLFFRILLDKFNEYVSKKTQLLHRQQPPASQEELDEVEEMVTNLEKQEAEKCRDIIAKLSKIICIVLFLYNKLG